LPHLGASAALSPQRRGDFLRAVIGLTCRQAYKDIFAITIIKTLAVFVVIGVFYGTGWV